MNKPAFDDINYWHKKAQHLDDLYRRWIEL